MNTDFDFAILDNELDGILGIDMSEFGFEKTADIDLDHFFENVEPKEKDPKTVKCPHCGGLVEI